MLQRSKCCYGISLERHLTFEVMTNFSPAATYFPGLTPGVPRGPSGLPDGQIKVLLIGREKVQNTP